VAAIIPTLNKNPRLSDYGGRGGENKRKTAAEGNYIRAKTADPNNKLPPPSRGLKPNKLDYVRYLNVSRPFYEEVDRKSNPLLAITFLLLHTFII